MTSLPPMLRDRTAVVSLQNGVDNEDKLAAAIGAEAVCAILSPWMDARE